MNVKCEHGCGADALVQLDDGRCVCGPCSVGGNPGCEVCTPDPVGEAA